MRKTVVAAAGIVLVVGVGGVAVAQAGSADGPEPAYGARGTFTVVERATTDTTTDTGATGDSVGDVLTFHNRVYDRSNTKRVGSDNGSCIRTVAGAAYECSWSLALHGGSLLVSGPFYDTRDSVLAITGGTGKWSAAHGQMRLHARNAKGTAYDFTYAVK